MECRKNKRTLKKRIRGIISLTIFITVFLFSSLIILVTAEAFKYQAELVSGYICNSLAANMNSDFFHTQLGIKGLENFDPTGEKEALWIESLKKNEDFKPVFDSTFTGLTPQVSDLHKVTVHFENDPKLVSFPGFNSGNVILNTIELNGTIIYKTLSPGQGAFIPYQVTPNNKPHTNPIGDGLLRYFSNSDVSSNLLSSNGDIIGTVTTTIDSRFLVFIYMILAVCIILAGLFSIFIANIIGKLLSFSITTPLVQLEGKINLLANEDFDNGEDRQIILKKPLREIESLANSTNLIMRKMKEYSHLLEDQKITLENQNDELEAQNEELTDSKRKIEDAQTMLVQSENMASIGQLTAAITHEINTPLGAINSNVQIYDMLLKMLEENNLIHDHTELLAVVEQMKETNSINILACQRVIEIIKSLKTFSKLDQAEFQEVNITDGIKSVLILTSNLWKNKIKIHEEYGSLPMVKCFPGLLNQVFMNVLVNAIQAVEDKGDIYIKTYADNSYINISIRDTGVGIKDDHIPRIFEAGFSTKETGMGAGLGLSICFNIIQKHNGIIEVKTSPGNGSEFIIKIPVNC